MPSITNMLNSDCCEKADTYHQWPVHLQPKLVPCEDCRKLMTIGGTYDEGYAPAITFAVSKKNWTGNSEILGSPLNSETVWLEMMELPISVSFLINV